VSLAELSRRAGDRVDAERRLRGVPDEFETARFVRIRLALADGRAESALGEAESLTAEEIRAGRVPRLAAAHALAALALDGLGRRADALARLGTALSLVAPGTYRRAILDQGSGVGRLLRLVDPRSEAVEAFRSDLLTRLEDAPSRGEPGAPIAPEHTPRNRGGLVEHLGNRELDVLPLLAAGLSNADIARALYIGPGTAKWHVHNILAKLGIERRAQVAIRARELGLLPK